MQIADIARIDSMRRYVGFRTEHGSHVMQPGTGFILRAPNLYNEAGMGLGVQLGNMKRRRLSAGFTGY